MKEVLLIRHAKSSWEFANLKDEERPLNKRGHRDAPRMAEFCKSNNLNLTHLISSMATRAFTTAEYFQKAYSIELSKETELYFGDDDDWMHIINNLDSKVDFPAFFSHNPTITYFANMFEGDYIENVPTCGIVHLQSTVDDWSKMHFDNTSIKNFYYPKML